MKRRFLSVFLCFCLLIPSIGFSTGETVLAQSEYVILPLDFRIATAVTLHNSGQVYASESVTFDAIDLTQYNYAEDPSRIALQIDTYVSGDEAFLAYAESGLGGGQVEISSSGIWDTEELSCSSSEIAFKSGEWVRVLLPLSIFTTKYGDEFCPESFNFLRIYLADHAPQKYVGASGMVKIINPCLVDTAVPEEERPDTQVGDGSFVPDAPVFHKVTVTQGYDDSTSVFAGYDLREYLATHTDITVTDRNGNRDYSAVVNSLLSGLQQAGGGTLFIPAGEWEFRSEIVLPPGVSICGEWNNPDKNPEIRGTILKVYCGGGSSTGTPFIDMEHHTKVQNISIWYPEQSVQKIVEYPASIQTDNYTFVQNVTLVNSYIGIANVDTACCPNAWNIYGTPLCVGVDFDQVVDIARIEELHFAAKYWEESQLSGAPASSTERDLLEEYLYDYGIGLTLRRIDWSYANHSDFSGYNIGLLLAASSDGVHYPNGQCAGLNFAGCKYGVFVYGVNYCTEAFSEFVVKDCEYGIYLTERDDGVAEGTLNIYAASIEATKQAIYQGGMVQLNVMNSTIYRGAVVTTNGNNTFINNQMYTAGPQILLDYGTVSAVLIGNTDYYNEPISYVNAGLCTLGYDETKADIDSYVPMTREEAMGEVKTPTSTAHIIPNDLDNTGETDVTEALQAYLTALGRGEGGTLFLVPGKYRIDGAFTIPRGVELRGSGDFATIPMAANTILQVYTKVEDGKTAENTTATVTMEEASGIRGIIFNYPEQNSTYRVIETVYDPVANTNVDYYRFDFTPYPYTVRGTGAGVYLVNVTVRNGWNGVDFATFRCDDHYVDYLAGHFFHRGITIGNGSKDGYVRNFQFNYNSILAPYVVTWFGFGGVPSLHLQNAFHQPMQAQFNNHSVSLQLGYVENQLIYNCFNYSSFIGVHLIEEGGRAADARIIGHGVDYGTQAVKIEAAEHVAFANLQVTSFNQCGADGNTERWAVDQSITPLYTLWLTDSFEGRVNVYNFSEWGAAPNAGVRVDSGELRLYNSQFNNNGVPTFELNNDGVIYAYGVSFVTTSGLHYITVENPPLVSGTAKNLHVTGGFYRNRQREVDEVGTYRYVYPYTLRYAVPKNAIFPENATMVAVESFDDYSLDDTVSYQGDNAACVSASRGKIRIVLDDKQFAASLCSVADEKGAYPFRLGYGNADDIYRLEWRLNVAEMRGTVDSEIYLQFHNTNGKNAVILSMDKDGCLRCMGQTFGRAEYNVDYRLAIEIDARRTDNKTVRAFLLDDTAQVIAASAAIPMNDIFQGGNTVCGFRFGAIATPYEAVGTKTDVTVDYFFVIQSEESTLAVTLRGDVDGNGKVDSTDARLVLQYAVKKIATLPNANVADVDGNGNVDSTDARLILQYAVKKINKFPAA